jgi:UDP-glucose:glycoprotein glucosyltransferase
LDRARKIPEWEEYDREVAAFAKSLQKSNEIAAADVDILASPDSFAGEKKADADVEQPPGMTAEDTEESLVQQRHQGEDQQNDQYRNIDEL